MLFDQAGYPDVVREAQEIVELALKGMLRRAGISGAVRILDMDCLY